MPETIVFHIIGEKFDQDSTISGSIYVLSEEKKSKSDPNILIGEKNVSIEDLLSYRKENYPGSNVVAILNASCILYKYVPVTINNRRQMLQALPYMLEESIINSIDDVHISIFEKWTEGIIRASIINKDIINKVNEKFSDKKIDVKIYGLPDIINIIDNELIMVIFDNFSIIKSKNICIQIDNENLFDFISAVNKEEINSFFVYRKMHLESSSSEISESLNIIKMNPNIKFEEKYIESDPLIFLLTRHFHGSEKIDISSGVSRGGSKYDLLFNYAKPILLTLYILALIQISFNFISGFYFYKRTERSMEVAGQHYLKKFPNESRVVDVKSQIDGKLKSLQINLDPGHFSKIFGVASDAIIKTGEKKNIVVKSIKYDDLRMELKIEIEAINLSLLDVLKNEIVSRGISAEILSANQANQVVRATLVVKPI